VKNTAAAPSVVGMGLVLWSTTLFVNSAADGENELMIYSLSLVACTKGNSQHSSNYATADAKINYSSDFRSAYSSA